jgi:predicted  nucleic acid-binding Zn-ribbon protein
MNIKNTANTRRQRSQRYKTLGYSGLIALTLLTTSCEDKRTQEQINTDSYTERVEEKEDLEAEILEIETNLEEAKGKLFSLQIRIADIKTKIKDGDDSLKSAKKLQNQQNEANDLQEKIDKMLEEKENLERELNIVEKQVKRLANTL